MYAPRAAIRCAAGLVDQIAVLDRAHAAVDRARDRLGRIRVRHDVGAEARRLLDGRRDLVDAKLQALERIALRRDAARHHQLDLVGALAKLVAHRLQHLGDAVGDAAHVGKARAARAFEARLRGPAEVGVPAGLADRHAGDEQARAVDDAVVDRRLHAVIAAARVAHAS